MSLYERDFHAWAMQQAELAKSRAHKDIDWPNVAEELESLGRQQRSELRSRYLVLLTHLLKWAYQPERRSRSWERTIADQRQQIAFDLDDSPSLASDDLQIFQTTYPGARKKAARETRLPLQTFPEDPPFSLGQVRDEDFWPGAKDA